MDVEANLQGAHHDNCCLETSKCQAENRRATEEMSVLCRKHLSALGAGQQTSQRYACSKCEGVSLSLLSLPANVSALSRREYECRSDERLRAFAVLLWSLGLSHRASSLILSGVQTMVSFMTIWRDVQAEAQKVKRRNQWKRVRVLGLDGAYVLGWGEKQPVLVAVDLGTGEPITVGYVNEYDPQAIVRWLRPLVQRHGISVIVTDDLSSYKIVGNSCNLGHQIC